MQYNAVLDKQFSGESTTEPVSLVDFKRHLNMLFDTEGSYEFNDDDAYLTILIKQARAIIEAYTGVSLITRTVTAILRNDCGNIELPYGPVGVVASVVDADDVAFSSNTIQGLQFKWLVSPCACYVKVQYAAGYAVVDVPAPLIRAILEQGAFMYKNRGDQQQEYAAANVSICQSAMEEAAPFKRTGFVV